MDGRNIFCNLNNIEPLEESNHNNDIIEMIEKYLCVKHCITKNRTSGEPWSKNRKPLQLETQKENAAEHTTPHNLISKGYKACTH